MASFFPDRERYTKSIGPILESAGITLLLGVFIVLAAYRAWSSGLNEILLVFLSPEFLWDPTLFLGLAAVSFLPSAIWLLLHPLIDAHRIDRNPHLENHITRDYGLLCKEALAWHILAFTSSAAAGMFLLGHAPPQLRMPAALAVYGLVHGLLHFIRNRTNTRFSRLTNRNLQSHLYDLILADPPRFRDTVRLLGAVWAFNHGMPNRMAPILLGEERLNPHDLLTDLDMLIHNFPPREGLESLLRVTAPSVASRYHPVIDQLLLVLAAKTRIPHSSARDTDIGQLLAQAPRDKPIQILCACLRNFNRSPAMAACLQSLLEARGLAARVHVASGGIAPIARPNLQLVTLLRERGISTEPHRPSPITDATLAQAQLVLAADVTTALTLAWRLLLLDPKSLAHRKIVLFTSLDRPRFHGRDKLPDPAEDPITLRDSIAQIHETLERAFLPVLAAAAIPPRLVTLAGLMLRGLFPGDLPQYQLEKRLRLCLALARNDPGYLIHIDRKNYKNRELPPDELRFVWNQDKTLNQSFLAQLCARFPEREEIRRRSPFAKDYANSMVALASLLSPVVHQIFKASREPPLPP